MTIEPAPLQGIHTVLAGADWQVVCRPGYVGHRGAAAAADHDACLGQGRWTIAYLWRDGVISRAAALSLYEDAYFHFLGGRRDVLDWLCATASEIYDTAPSNVDSGLDYHAQEGGPTHLQDIAIRRALQRLGRALAGDHLVQIRGRQSEGYRLNPGEVPFHDSDGIIKPALPGWWRSGSIEDFWQSNKVLLAARDVPEASLAPRLLRPLQPVAAGLAHFGGSFNPIHNGHLRIATDLVERWGFSKVVFVPNGDWYRKRELAPATERLRMVELAIAGESRFAVSDHEVSASQQVLLPDSVRVVRATADQAIHVVRGSDSIARMLRWRSLPDILASAVVIVVPRPGAEPWSQFGNQLRFRLSSHCFRVLQRGEEDDTSSSEVRARIARGESIEGQVPETVGRTIVEKRLYG